MAEVIRSYPRGGEGGAEPPDWLVDLALATLSDGRYATEPRTMGFGFDARVTLARLAARESHLFRALGSGKCRRAVPALIEMAGREKPSADAIEALGAIGDRRAVPALLDVLRREGKRLTEGDSLYGAEPFNAAARALGRLKAREAVPLLAAHVAHADVVEVLEQIGDPAAAPAIERWIGDAPAKARASGATWTGPAQPAAVRLALITLKERDPIPAYCGILADRSAGESGRIEAAWRLRDRPDPRAVPHLLAAIRADPSGAVVQQAVAALSAFKHKSAVEGLIDCFDADFAGKDDWKRAYAPEMFRENIAESLRAITGQPIGPDKELWLAWWRAEGARSAGLR